MHLAAVALEMVMAGACPPQVIGDDTLAVLEGRLSPRVLGLVTEWAALHQNELRENWRLARQQAPPRAIAPLE